MASLGELIITIGAQISGFTDAMKQVDATLAGLGDSATKFLDNFEGLGSKLVEGLAIGSLTAAVFEAGKTIEDVMSDISRQTGVTGDALEQLGGTFQSVFADSVQSASDLGSGLSLLAQRTGATGEELKSLLDINSKLAQVTGQQLAPMIDQTQKLFAQWGITVAEQPAKLDALLAISQKTGISISALGGTMQTAGATLRTMGVSFNDAAALMANFETHGINSQRIMMALNQSLIALGKEGVTDASGVLGDLINKVVGAANPMQALNAISQDFKGRGLVPLVDALRQGVGGIEALRAVAQGSVGAIQNSVDSTAKFGEQLTKLKNQSEVLLAPLGLLLVEALSKVVEAASAGLRVLGELGTSFGQLSAPVQIAVGSLGALSAAILLLGREAIIGAIAAVGEFSLSLTSGLSVSIMAAVASLSELSLAGFIAGLEAAGAAVLAFVGSIAGMGVAATAALSEISFASVVAGLSSLTFSVEGVAAAVSGLTASVLPALSGILATLAVAVTAVAAAFVGWKFGEWLRENLPLAQKFGDTIGDWILKIPGVNALIMQFSGANEGAAAATSSLTATTQALAAKLAEHGIIVQRGMMSLDEYAKALQDAAKNATATGEAHKAAAGGVDILAKAFKDLGLSAQQAPTAAQFQKATAAFNQIDAAYANGSISLSLYNEAVKKYGEETDKFYGILSKAGPIDEFGKALKALGIPDTRTELGRLGDAVATAQTAFDQGSRTASDYAATIAKLDAAEADLIDPVKKAHDAFLIAGQDYKEGTISVQGYAGKLNDLIDILPATQDGIQKQANAIAGLNQNFLEVIKNIPTVDGALKNLGLKTVPELNTAVKDARANFDAVSEGFRNGTATSEQLTIAWNKLHDAEMHLSQDRLDQRALGIPDLGVLQETLRQAQGAYEDLASKGLLNATTKLEGMVTQQRLAIDVAMQQGQDTTNLRIDLDATTEALDRQANGMARLAASLKQVELGGLQSAFHDLLFDIGKVGDDFKKLGESMVDVVVNRIIKDAMSPLLDALDKVIAKGVTAIEKVAGIGVNSIPTGGSGGFPVSIPSFPSGVTDIGAAGTGAIGDIASNGDTIAGIGSPAASAAGGSGAFGGLVSAGLSSTIGLVTGAVSAISGVIGNFQNAHMIDDLKSIELNTRITAIAMEGNWKSGTDSETMFAFSKTTMQKVSDMRDFNWTVLHPDLNIIANYLSTISNSIAGVTHIDLSAVTTALSDIKGVIVDRANLIANTMHADLVGIWGDMNKGKDTLVGLFTGAKGSGNSVGPVTINVYGGTSDAATIAKEVADYLRTLSPVFS